MCTHNDINGLKTTLKSLESQRLETEHFEVIIVDNASFPSLHKQIFALSIDSPLIIRYTYEGTIGLSNARNNGIRIAKSSKIAITDPENVPDPDWLLQICDVLEGNTQLKLVGGKLEDVVEGQLTWYFPKELTEYFTPTQWPTKVESIKFPYFATGYTFSSQRL